MDTHLRVTCTSAKSRDKSLELGLAVQQFRHGIECIATSNRSAIHDFPLLGTSIEIFSVCSSDLPPTTASLSFGVDFALNQLIYSLIIVSNHLWMNYQAYKFRYAVNSKLFQADYNGSNGSGAQLAVTISKFKIVENDVAMLK